MFELRAALGGGTVPCRKPRIERTTPDLIRPPVRLHGDQCVPGLDLAFVVPSFLLRDAQPDQRADQAGNGGTPGGALAQPFSTPVTRPQSRARSRATCRPRCPAPSGRRRRPRRPRPWLPPRPPWSLRPRPAVAFAAVVPTASRPRTPIWSSRKPSRLSSPTACCAWLRSGKMPTTVEWVAVVVTSTPFSRFGRRSASATGRTRPRRGRQSRAGGRRQTRCQRVLVRAGRTPPHGRGSYRTVPTDPCGPTLAPAASATG